MVLCSPIMGLQIQPDKSVIFLICALCLALSGLLWLFVKNDRRTHNVSI